MKRSKFLDKNGFLVFLTYLTVSLITLFILVFSIPYKNDLRSRAMLDQPDLQTTSTAPKNSEKKPFTISPLGNDQTQEKPQRDDECFAGGENNGGCGPGYSCAFRGGIYRCIEKKITTTGAIPTKTIVKEKPKEKNNKIVNNCYNDLDCVENFFCDRSKKPYDCKQKKQPVNYCSGGKIVISGGNQWCYREKGEEPICLDCKITATPPLFIITTTPVIDQSDIPMATSPVVTTTPIYTYPTHTAPTTPTVIPPVSPEASEPTPEIDPRIPTITPFTTSYCSLGKTHCDDGFVYICSFTNGKYFYQKTAKRCSDSFLPTTTTYITPTPRIYQPEISNNQTCTNPLGSGCLCTASINDKIIADGQICNDPQPEIQVNQVCTERWCRCKYNYGLGGVFSSSILIGTNTVCTSNHYCNQGIFQGVDCLLNP